MRIIVMGGWSSYARYRVARVLYLRALVAGYKIRDCAGVLSGFQYVASDFKDTDHAIGYNTSLEPDPSFFRSGLRVNEKAWAVVLPEHIGEGWTAKTRMPETDIIVLTTRLLVMLDLADDATKVIAQQDEEDYGLRLDDLTPTPSGGV